ncbi:hypothetical protein HCN44_009185 [Aphidius gifuensis]|uniref:Uncharacterized protein n=1 Tax=Aphidius gifuensis TaxID=684658 RepID=A0A835CVT4_APHGI|nr:hypothetical protein HCN44_009185 [Aphidius gifuensis]
MLHESIQKDPTNVSKRKPRQLRGTPANRVGTLLIGGGLLAFVTLGELFMYSDLSNSVKTKFTRIFTKTPEEIEKKIIMQEQFMASIAIALEKKKAGEIEPRVNQV